jgi:hypothetical protein
MIVMSENRSRFKMKKGDIEIEYEGNAQDVNTKYTEAFGWIKQVVPPAPPKEPEPGTERKEKAGEKPSGHGGVRSNVVSKEIDKLIEEGWIDKPKKPDDVTAELVRRAVPGAKTKTIEEALKRRVPKKLDRIKDTNGEWTYIRKKA